MIEFDVETAPHLQWYAGAHPFLYQFWTGEGEPVLLRPGTDDTLIQDWLRRDDGYRAHNSKFDLHMARAQGFELPPEDRWHDGMVKAHLMDERYSVALQARSCRLFPEDEEQIMAPTKAKDAWLAEERKRRQKEAKDSNEQFVPPNYSDIPSDIIEPYAIEDVIDTRRVGDVYDPAVAAIPELQSLYDLEMKVMGALFWMEDRGVPVERDSLVALEANLLPKLDSLEEKAIAIAEFDNFNPRSPKQIGEALERLDADIRFMSRSGKSKQLVTDEENLNACPHPLAETILDYRGTHKMWAMVRRMLHGDPTDELFPEPYMTGEDLLHPNFRQVGARHGRMSCSNPNFQQIPRDDLRLRYSVKARPGKKLVCVDLDGIELRVMAAFAGDGALKDMVRSGGDPHTYTARMVGLTGRRRAGGSFESPRDQGKRFNYLMGYGGGVTAVKKRFHKTSDEARAMIERYKKAYPEIAALGQRIEYTLEDRGYIKSPWGRRHRVYSARNAYREAYKFTNYLVSGTSADLFKEGTAKCHAQGVPLIAAVHDELIAEVDASDAEEAGHIMVEALTNHPRITEKVPITAEAQIVDRWSDAKKPGYVPDYLQEAS